MELVATVLLLVLRLGVAVAGGSPACPCVTVSLPSVGSCLSPSCNSPLQLNQSFCMSTTYGSGSCAAWDELSPDCMQGDPRPAHCAQNWCYVDSAICRHATGERPPRYAKSAYFSEVPNLFYSYETCGGDRTVWEAYQHIVESSTRVLTAVVPSMTYEPYHFKRDPSTGAPYTAHQEAVYQDDSEPYHGVLVEYLTALSRASFTRAGPAGFNLTWVSRPSRGAHASRWTAGVEDVKSGLADLGVSIFWTSPERLEMSAFTAPLTTDLMYLFVPVPVVENSLFSQISAPFDPFTLEVWVAIFAVIILSGTLRAVLTKWLWWEDWTKEMGYESASRPQKVLMLSTRLAGDWYETFITVINGAPEFNEAHRISTRILNVGVGFFACIVIAAYTANLAAFLGQRKFSDPWKNLDDATSAGAKICAHTQLQSILTKTHPSTHFYWRYMDTASEVREALAVDGCDAFIASMRAMLVGGAIDDVRCEYGLIATNTPVAQLEVAMPAAPTVADAMSYWMKRLSADDQVTYDSIQSAYKVLPRCAMYHDIGETGELASLNLINFSAPLFLVLISFGLAVCTRATRVATKKVVRTVRKSILAERGAPQDKLSAELSA